MSLELLLWAIIGVFAGVLIASIIISFRNSNKIRDLTYRMSDLESYIRFLLRDKDI